MSILMPYILEMGEGHKDTPIYIQIWHSIFHVAIFWLFYRTLQIHLHKRYSSYQDSIKRNVIQFIIVLLSAPVLKIILNISVESILAGDPLLYTDRLPSTFSNILRIYIPSFLILAIYESAFYFSKYREQLLRNERLEKIHAESQLTNLRNQINPHFLFNSLNVLMNLIPVEPDAAMSFLDKLSKFYRYTVGDMEGKLTSLTKELEMSHLYAELLQVRFRDALTFNFPEDIIVTANVLPMSLQLLMENAIKHNIVSRSEPLTIDISISDDGHYVVICNNLQPKIEAVSSTGVGLGNIRNRLAFFTKVELEIHRTDDEFCVRLPLI